MKNTNNFDHYSIFNVKDKIFRDNLFRELIVDNFAGGGGASTGIELALGQPVDIAINHDENAILMHEFNHPFTHHIRNDVFAVDPDEVTDGRPVGLAWFSPDCTHFSKAKGGKPKKKEIRDLAWVVIKWAKAVKPRIIMLENVEEFKTWGPLDADGYPIKELAGETFNEWMNELKELGYVVEVKELRACDYGAPTTRKRLFIVARSDGQPIVWPEPTHGNGPGLIPYRTAAEIIDWSVKGKSIFNRKKPLVKATLRRVTRGIDRFVIKNPKPFILQYHSETSEKSLRAYDINEPLLTIDGSNRFALTSPTIMRYFSDKRDYNGGLNGKSKPVNFPLNTITSFGGGNLVTPIMAQIGQVGFKSDRLRDIKEPLSTVVSKNEHLLVTPVMAVNMTNHPGGKADEPLKTILSNNHHCVISPSIIPIGYGEAPKQLPRVNDLKEPLGTVVSSAKHHIVIPHIVKHFSGSGVKGSGIDEPLPTITSIDHNGLVSAIMSNYYGNGHNASAADEPLKTVIAREISAVVKIHFRKVSDSNIGNWPLIRELLNEHAGYTLADDEIIVFEVNGIEYIMVDIEMRMLLPKELYAAQGFPSDYNYHLDGKMSKTEQIKKCGNAVCPPLSYALARANCVLEYKVPKIETMEQLYHFTTYGSLRQLKDKESS